MERARHLQRVGDRDRGFCGDDDKGVEVLCPTNDGMRDVAREDNSGNLRLRLYQRWGSEGAGRQSSALNATSMSAVLR